jgi:hypothetical protein
MKKVVELNEEIEEKQEEINYLYDRLDKKTDSYDGQIKAIIYRYADVEGPIVIRYQNDNGPCIICGCKSELDEYGDRICHCDSCYKDGCCEEWPVVGRFPGKRRL